MLRSDLLAIALARCKFEEKESPPGRINSSNDSSDSFNSSILLKNHQSTNQHKS